MFQFPYGPQEKNTFRNYLNARAVTTIYFAVFVYANIFQQPPSAHQLLWKNPTSI